MTQKKGVQLRVAEAKQRDIGMRLAGIQGGRGAEDHPHRR